LPIPESDVIRGLSAGAQDYIANPFRPNELLARLRAQLRAFEDSQDAILTIGQYFFRPAMKLLQDPTANRCIRLTSTESDVLKFLCRSKGRPVKRQTLLQEVWGYNEAIATHTLETHIYRLRKKISGDPAKSVLLVSDRRGYRLDAGPSRLTDHAPVRDVAA
jgi:DNA-binding response OmpR family regulator